jgi:hypothetical protein
MEGWYLYDGNKYARFRFHNELKRITAWSLIQTCKRWSNELCNKRKKHVNVFKILPKHLASETFIILELAKLWCCLDKLIILELIKKINRIYKYCDK